MARQPTAASSDELESAAEDVRHSVRDLRSLVVDLTPATVQEQGLASALQDLARRMGNGHVAIDVVTHGTVDRVDPVAARLLYRVALEGLRNVVQHADAATARVTVSVDGTWASLEVSDDGSGFEPAILASRAAAGHVGLRALHGIVVDAGGTFEVVSAPGAGTTVLSRGADPMIRVVIVDDHAVVRSGLERLLSTADDIIVVGAAADGREAIALVDEVEPDVVMMDLSMPQLDGVAATQQITAAHPGTAVVVLTSFSDTARITAALRAGSRRLPAQGRGT